MIHFQLIFVKGIGLHLDLFLFLLFFPTAYGCPVAPAPYVEKIVFSPLNCHLLLCPRSIYCICVSLFSGLLWAVDTVLYSFINTTLSDYASFILSFDIGSCQSSDFIFLLLHHIGYFRPFYFHITFKIKITYQNFDWDYIK